MDGTNRTAVRNGKSFPDGSVGKIFIGRFKYPGRQVPLPQNGNPPGPHGSRAPREFVFPLGFPAPNVGAMPSGVEW